MKKTTRFLALALLAMSLSSSAVLTACGETADTPVTAPTDTAAAPAETAAIEKHPTLPELDD